MKINFLIPTVVLAHSLMANECGFSGMFYAEVDYLLWYANQSGLSYTMTADVTSTVTSSPVTTTEVDQKDNYFKNNWDSGVRVALGFKPMNFCWDAKASYTYFYTGDSPKERVGEFSSSAQGNPSGNIIFSEFYDNIINNIEGTTTTYSNKSRWKFDFNQLDLEMGREILLVHDMIFRPFWGVRGLETQQKLSMEVSQPYILGSLSMPVLGMSDSQFRAKNRFTGVGIKTGVDTGIALGGGFELSGQITGSLLWGRFSVNEFQNLIVSFDSIITDANTLNDNYHRKFHSTIYNFDLFLGIKWNYRFSCGQNLLSLKAGWEQHYFSEMNQFQNPDALAVTNQSLLTNPAYNTLTVNHNFQRGSLSLQGFIFSLALSF